MWIQVENWIEAQLHIKIINVFNKRFTIETAGDPTADGQTDVVVAYLKFWLYPNTSSVYSYSMGYI